MLYYLLVHISSFITALLLLLKKNGVKIRVYLHTCSSVLCKHFKNYCNFC